MIPTFATIAYSPVRSFSPRLGLFSLKNWDRTATQSGPNFFGDCTTVRSRISRPDRIVVESGPDRRTIIRSGPKIWDRTAYKSVRSSPVPVPQSGPVSLSVAISILTELPNTLAEYPSTYKCCPCICSVKTPVRPCISPAVTPITGFALQPSYSDPCHWSRYYRSCRHKSSSPCNDSYYYYSSGQLCDYFCHYNTS